MQFIRRDRFNNVGCYKRINRFNQFNQIIFYNIIKKFKYFFLLNNKIDTKVIILTIKDTRITVKFDRQTNL